MSLFAEFHVPSETFALHQTLQAVPDVVVVIERVVAAQQKLTPYFWVAGETDAFEQAVANDPSITDLHRVDEFDDSSLYRGTWTQNVENIVYAYTELGATIVEATGQADEWELRIRFDDRAGLREYRNYCEREHIPFALTGLYEIQHERSGAQFGLTPKQHEALTTAWEWGYFKVPREASLDEIADQLGITKQALSERIQRAIDTFVANALEVTPPSELGGWGHLQ